MICQNFQVVDSYVDDNGKRKRKIIADILSTNTPSTFPKDGVEINGLDENCVLAPQSTIYVVNGGDLYMADEDVNFVLQ